MNIQDLLRRGEDIFDVVDALASVVGVDIGAIRGVVDSVAHLAANFVEDVATARDVLSAKDWLELKPLADKIHARAMEAGAGLNAAIDAKLAEGSG